MTHQNATLGFSRLEVLLIAVIVSIIGAGIFFLINPSGQRLLNLSSVSGPAASGAGTFSTGTIALAANENSERDDDDRGGGTNAGVVSSEFGERSSAIALPNSGNTTNGAEELPDGAIRAQSGNTQSTHALPDAFSDIEAELKRIEGLPWGPDTEKQLHNILAQWVQRDPVAALAYAINFESRRAGTAAVNLLLAQWAQRDPAAAFDWFKQNLASNPQLLAGAASSLFGKLAETDPALALNNVWQLSQKNVLNKALDAIVNQMMANDQKDQLLRYFNGMNDTAAQSMLAKAMVNQWALYYPEMTADWISGLTDPAVRKNAAMTLISTWGYDNPAKAALWVAGLPKDQDWTVEVERVIDIWSREYPDKAAAWLTTLSPPSAQLDPAVRELVRTVMYNNPEGAMAWANAVYSTDQRYQLMRQVGIIWLKKDPAQATAYIINSDLPNNMKKKLLGY